MSDKKEINQLQKLLQRAVSQGNLLDAVEKNQQEKQLLNLLEPLESAVLLARRMAEERFQQTSKPAHRSSVWTIAEIAGTIEVNPFGWVHITLNTLLPHCRFKTPAYLTDTISRLLRSYKGKLPWFEKAILIIDEHCDLANRQIYDQDNKGWKAIPNAVKGVLVPDDDQFTLELALLSTLDETPSCHIYVLPAEEAGEFFSLRTGQYGFCL